MTCKMCRERGKDWSGDDPKCAFPKGGPFTADNWNCATANAIRDLCGSRWDPTDPKGVKRGGSEDQYWATIELDCVDLEDYRVCLYVGWYKNRGRTEAMWLMPDVGDPRPPTEAEALAIIELYKEHAHDPR